MEPANGINKDVCGVKLQPMTVSAYPVDFDCLIVSLTERTVLLSVS